MAIVVPYLELVSLNGVSLADHCRSVALSYGQETKDVTTLGDTARKFRPGLANVALDVEFFDDLASGSVNATLRGMVSITSTSGIAVIAQRYAPNSSDIVTATSNPKFTFTGVLDGDLNVMNDQPGEVPVISARLVPLSGSLSIGTTTSSS